MERKAYAAIDLKSFYASVECVERGLDPMDTHLVVADEERTDKTICLAVTPPLKARGVPGRPRLFEVRERVREINARRRMGAQAFAGASHRESELAAHPDWELKFLVARPRMALYLQYSARVYAVYLRFVAPEDIHVYSVDEVFLDLTPYVPLYGCTARELTSRMIREVYRETGLSAAAGLGTNLYLCKIAMDIGAKHAVPDAEGVRIAELDEERYRRELWSHEPLTDFWRVGRGYANKLRANGLFTMGDIARCSLGGPGDVHNPELLYRLFGVNAELLIDHAWGEEPCTLRDIKTYQPEERSVGSGQVLSRPYANGEAALVLREMAEALALDLTARGLAAGQIVLSIGYDRESLRLGFRGRTRADAYGRRVPEGAHGSLDLGGRTASCRRIAEAAGTLFARIADPALLVRRLNLTACRLGPAGEASCVQISFFDEEEAARRAEDRREESRQRAVLAIRERYGGSAIFRGCDLLAGATGLARSAQIGGHRA
ncbi:MAG: DNA methylase [Candidatus Spyradocola sp.]|jgi:DNA polymerase V